MRAYEERTPGALPLSRRDLLRGLSGGLGAFVLSSLFEKDDAIAGAPGPADPPPHHPARARSMIYMNMVGGTSHIDLLDPKPVLRARDGEACPDSLYQPEKLAFIRSRPSLFGSPYDFESVGGNGAEISELLPHLKGVVDDIAIVRSMRTDEFNHGPAQLFLLTGYARFGRPSIGAWASFGLGSENDDLPTYVVLTSGKIPGSGSAAWGSGFLPSSHAGVPFRVRGDPVLYLSNPPGVSNDGRRGQIQLINELNGLRYDAIGDPEIEARMEQYELAFRMQASVPGAVDLEDEPDEVLELYGAQRSKPSFARNCILARRMIERGVRFVQLFDSDWDHHAMISELLPLKCRDVDRASAALVTDLKRRGLLDDTLVVWNSEFGRTPMAQAGDGVNDSSLSGRDHHQDAFSIWLAGGGVTPGLVYGRTDELGANVVENPVHVHDLNATLMHLLGIDHKRLTHHFEGRDFRLTDVHGEVVHQLIA
jgi:hypothetical protein